MTELRISPDLALPVDAVTETFAILAVKRSGKSNAAVVMAEELYDAGLPWVAIDPKGDWWGVRAAGDGQAPGLSVVVFGGEHGDVPLEPTAGRYHATDAAFDVLGDDFIPLPTGRALRDHWLATLAGGEQQILAELLDAYPNPVPRDVLSDATGYKRSSRDTYLQRLRARQLITTNGGDPRASDDLFGSE